MTSRLTRSLMLGLLLAAGGCSSGVSGWRYFHGDLPGEGFRNVKSGFAISPAWISESLRIVSSSPVIGRDEMGLEVLYVGTVDAQLVAMEVVRGKVLWKFSLDGPSEKARVTSTPALGPDGGIIITAPRGGQHRRRGHHQGLPVVHEHLRRAGGKTLIRQGV